MLIPLLHATSIHIRKVVLGTKPSSPSTPLVSDTSLGAFVLPNAPIPDDTSLETFKVPGKDVTNSKASN